jgi:hypothetical protein
VSAPATWAAPSWPGLLEKLMAVVRPEFRVDLLVPNPDHPVLGRGVCAVQGCDRSPTGNGFCSTHQKRWIDCGRPELPVFLADPGPPLNGRRDADRLQRGGMPLRKQWTRPVHAAPQRLDHQWLPRPCHLGRRRAGDGHGGAQDLRAAVLLVVDRERNEHVLQGP